MVCKKFLHIGSAWKIYAFSTTMAIITLILTTMIAELSNFSLFDTTEKVMNLTNYMDNNFHVLYYTANIKSMKDFLQVLFITSEAYSDRRSYHVSKNIPTADLMIHPDLHSIEVSQRISLKIWQLIDALFLFFNSLGIVT
ncbi:hypothetical protein PUN28_006491 [Cardiocondyla obscurior]|uniref:Uncharacterized protein n=1 Tax=Cardiocondyla obscurior TaxID=286306 RepID=A0AAW2GBS0_9HYME